MDGARLTVHTYSVDDDVNNQHPPGEGVAADDESEEEKEKEIQEETGTETEYSKEAQREQGSVTWHAFAARVVRALSP